MSDHKYGLPDVTFRYEGLFDFDGMYAALQDWGAHQGYVWQELSYKHKVPGPEGAEQEFRWRLHNKINDFVEHIILIEVHLWDFKEIEVNGQSLSSGRMHMVIKGTVHYDWQEKFSSSPMGKFLGKWYMKFMFKDLADYWDKLYYRVWDLHAMLKTHFDLKSQGHAYKGYLGEN